MTSVLANPSATALPQVPNLQEHTSILPKPSTSAPDLNGTDASGTSTTNKTTSNVPRGPVTASLNFYSPPANAEKPWNYVDAPASGPQRNYGEDAHAIPLTDARGKESTFALDTAAFALLTSHPHNPAIDWSSDASIKATYYPEVTRLLLAALPGAPSRVLLFDHTIRRASPAAPRAPVTRAHIDQTAASAAARVALHLPDEAAQLLKSRYRIVNVWRPLTGPVESFPLAFADSATVRDEDMVPVEHRYPTRTGETAAVRYHEGQEWYYWSGMGVDERVLLQCFDSERPMNRVPHSAFVDPRSGEASRPRESIEVRALVFG